MSDRKVGKKYKLQKKLGSGSFGDVYLAVDVHSGEEVAVKLEKVKTKHPQLLYESKVYRALQGGRGIASLRWYGVESHYNVLVTDRLGKSLEDHFGENGRKFDDLTTLVVGEQMVERIEYMHQMHFIHRDIKPDNFMSGIGRDQATIFVIDFGLSKRYRHPKTKRHIPYREGKNLTGTPRYASVNNHLGVEQSRRDDMESIGYVLVYFARGALPWQGLKANTKKQKYQKIMDKKMSVSITKLCENTPDCLRKFIEYARSLRYEDKPNYGYLKLLFSDTVRNTFGDGPHYPEWVSRRVVGRTADSRSVYTSAPPNSRAIGAQPGREHPMMSLRQNVNDEYNRALDMMEDERNDAKYLSYYKN